LANRSFASHNGSGKIILMSAAFEEITKEALKLSRQQRLALAGFLLEIDTPSSNNPEVEAAWEQEILARIQAIDDGTASGVSYEEVMRAARDRLAP
jgi:putative addiction module component (TIGR02574 family)